MSTIDELRKERDDLVVALKGADAARARHFRDLSLVRNDLQTLEGSLVRAREEIARLVERSQSAVLAPHDFEELKRILGGPTP